MSGAASFLAELKRRNVFRAAAFYAASAWLLVQVATQVFPFFNIANWVVRWIVIAAIIGVPFAMLFAWFYEWTPQGIQRESEVAPNESASRETGKKLDHWIIAILSLAVVLLLTNQFVLRKDAGGAVALPGKSIAVLPLLNESGDPHEDYFSDGLSEQLITNLAQIDGLKVIGRSSSFRFKGGGDDSKGIGEKLGVATLLEGTVRRQGERVRIVAELINVADGRELWSQTYDRELKDIFAVQSEIAHAVAESLKVKLMPVRALSASKHHVPSFETYDHFLLGKQALARNEPDGFKRAVEALRQAVAQDPDYALAYAVLAMAENFAVENNPDTNLVALGNRRAMAAAERAVALDPELGDGYGSRGYLRGTNDWDWNGAEADLIKAISLDPGEPRNQLRYGYLMGTLNRLPQASTALGKCIEHDPLFAPCWYWLGRIKAARADYEGARQAMNRVLAIDPGYKPATSYLGILFLLQGDPASARDLFAKLGKPAGIAMAEHDLGHAVQSSHALDQMIAAHATDSAYQIATIYAWWGDRDMAFVWLDRAIRQHDIGMLYVTNDPLLHGLHTDPRFAALLEELKLPLPAAATPTPAKASPSAPATGHAG